MLSMERDKQDTGETPSLAAGVWNWWRLPDSICMDGSPTGVAVLPQPAAKKPSGLMVFLEDGGACFDRISCAVARLAYKDHFAEHHFDARRRTVLQRGFFADASRNPFQHYHQAYVPNCSGDAHLGQKIDAPGAVPHRGFVNAQNALKALRRVFGPVPKLVLVGSSAGGFGALAMVPLLLRTFPEAQVTVVNISGPPLAAPVMQPCVQAHWTERWFMRPTLYQACGAACLVDQGGDIGEVWRVLTQRYPEVHFALITSLRDEVIRTYLALAQWPACPVHQGLAPLLADLTARQLPMTAAQAYESALHRLRRRLGQRRNFFTWFVDSDTHVVVDGATS
ncbi:MAG: pectin acetylesterase-family hydrolase, partial [Polyangiales bacterium]